MNLKTLNITQELLRIITELEQFNSTWEIKSSYNPEYLSHLRHVATIESIGSSTRIEGVKLTDHEIESLLGEVAKQSFSSRDEQEVIGYAEVMETVFSEFKDIQISENYIKFLHDRLLKYSSKDERHKGEYKKHSNSVEAFDKTGKSLGVVFETTSPFDTPRKMQELVYWTRESLEDKSYHPLIVIAVFNVVFLAIHPFQDGNGRLSRVLITLLMLKAGYIYIPYTSLESVIEKNKDSYYLALQRTQKTLKDEEDWEPWLNFFFRSLKKQKEHLEIKTNGIDKYSNLSEECALIMQYIEDNGRINLSKARELLANSNISDPTIKKRIAKLVKLGLIIRQGGGRSTWYSKKVY
ncbi:Fic family protein [Sulfurimonas sp. MAG313]|nr:Fic family protein [Sulfurimonas sp. MAG313]MDF1881422.1 Fic family protein [Sulfurimonas sp. MAG313]